MTRPRVVVIGAGIAGLSAALALTAREMDLVVLERAERPGGKMREARVGRLGIDAGPTVFTMRWVFDELLAGLGENLDDHVRLQPLAILARHAWSDGSRLDLFADVDRTAEAIGGFAGRADAAGYRAFCVDAKRIFDVLRQPFIQVDAPRLTALLRGTAMRDLMAIRPFQTMWKAVGGYFRDPRLQQLFGRYATYCGSSPFDAPATLMLVAHVESAGVWLIEGGMYRLAAALEALAMRRGVNFRHGAEITRILAPRGRATGIVLAGGERIDADAVICTADVAALGDGLFGPHAAGVVSRVPWAERSLSALTWSCVARAEGFPLVRHSVFFSRDYRAEFKDIFARGRLPTEPTVYVCAQDRDDAAVGPGQHERIFMLVNAPPIGDTHRFDATEVSQCAQRTFEVLERCGLTIRTSPELVQVTTPTDFHQMFPGTGGALYGRSSHGWMASFQRPGATTKMPGLYLAGGSVHPGPGVPMAALSGRMAAARLIADLALDAPCRTTAMPGGTSMH